MNEPTSQFAVSPDGIQKNIVRSARPAMAVYAHFSITDSARFRDYIGKRLGGGAAGSKPVVAKVAAGLLDVLKSTDARIQPEGTGGATLAGLPTTIAFTYSGLATLGINPVTLETFPEPFKEGMAARAHLLGDTGESAPENWEHWLGHRAVHGLIGILMPADKNADGARPGGNGSSPSHSIPRGMQEAYTNALALKAKLTQGSGYPPREFADLEQVAGIRILQLEVGLTPLKKFGDKHYRVEHFGFRDGMSQPFVDLGMSPPPAGGGTPRRDGTWSPVAPGEIFLGHPDEDGLSAIQPANRDLRLDGTYMVFRKLAQDVVGFAHFLKSNASDERGEELLGAQMFGRWRNGAPTVRHPSQSKYYGGNDEAKINDFRFHDEDPHGLKCPVGSHVRRVNPRDIQLRDVAKRHRILRQSIPYGGGLIEKADDWDGEERGLLFICYQARLDSQFEFIQREWINSGELFGQVGLNKCPVTGANDGASHDEFHVPGRPGPVSRIPRFVITRGGDYFFVPSMKALGLIGNGETFEPQAQSQYFQTLAVCDGAVNMGLDDKATRELMAAWAVRQGVDPATYASKAHIRPNPNLAETPSLFSDQRLTLAAAAILKPGSTTPTIRYRFTRRRDTQSELEDTSAVFLGQYEDVVKVLMDEATFGIDHYREHIEEIAHGTNMLMGLSIASPTRHDRMKILLAAIGKVQGDLMKLEPFARGVTTTVLARVLPAGRMDIVRDLALVVPVLTAKHFFGLPGPNRISPTAIAAMFARLEFTDIPPDWLAKMPAAMEHEKPFVTIQAWAQAAFREVFLNIVRARELTISSQRMTDEMLLHIDQLMEEEYRTPSNQPHLLATLMRIKRNPGEFGLRREDFQEPHALDKIDDHIRAILAELLVGGIYTVGKAMANIVDLMLSPDRIEKVVVDGRDRRDGLMAVLRECAGTKDDTARKAKLDAFIAECLRFKPVSPMLFRICKAKATINGAEINPGDLVCPMIEAANMDPRKFRDGRVFRLDRAKNDYLHFGPTGGPHRCLGELLAMAELRGMLQEIAQLDDFRRAAGPRGKLEELLRLPQSMVVRFAPKSQPRR